jgi:hypothetical protein
MGNTVLVSSNSKFVSPQARPISYRNDIREQRTKMKMKKRKRFVAVALLAAVAGCGVAQDPGQPAVGSISISSKSKDDDTPPPALKKPTKATSQSK